MIEPGFQPFPAPDPYNGPLGLQVQAEEFVIPSDPGVMIRRVSSGRVRVILTGSEERMRPYMDALAKLWEEET